MFDWCEDSKSAWAWTAVFTVFFALSVIPLIADFPTTYPWQDLMLNWRGGFIRRGLLGEIGLLCRPYAAEALCGLVCLAYAAAAFLFVKTVLEMQNPRARLLILLSSSLLLYGVVYPSAGLRKDAFVLLAFIAAMRTQKPLFAAVFMTLATFVHEETLFFVPLVMTRHKKTVPYFLAFGAVYTALTAFPKDVEQAVAESWGVDFGLAIKYISGKANPFALSPQYYSNLPVSYADWLPFFKTRIVPFSLLAIILTAAPIIVCLPKKLFKHPAVYAPLLLFSMPNWGRWESLILMAWVVSAATLEKGETGKNPPLLLFLPAFFALYPYTDFIFDMKSIVLFEPLPIFVLIALCLIYNASNVFKGAWQWITFKASDS